MRGSDELLHSPGGVLPNGAGMPPQLMDSNDAKKAKLDKGNNNTAPSRVVHFRSVPSEATEADLVHFGMTFGKVTNVLVLKGKNQAFLEMMDENVAATMVQYFVSCTAQILGRDVFLQFSNHKELKTDQTHSNANPVAQAALQAATSMLNSDRTAVPPSETQGGANTVLRVIIEHMIYPVTLEVLQTIFSRVGRVLKIVTFTKNSTFQALIQFIDVVTAQAAKTALDGQNIYNACCTLRIEYSKLSSLNVRYNNDKSRDYTNPKLPTGDQLLSNPLAQLPPGNYPNGAGGLVGRMPGLGGASLAGYPAGGIPGMPGMMSPMDRMREQVFMPGVPSFPSLSLAGMGGHPSLGALAHLQMTGHGVTPVIHVNNLHEETVKPDSLFTLFGVYGDVLRVKILYKKKDSALIEMADSQQAQLAINHLDRVKMWGKQIRVSSSRHQSVQLPKDGQPDAGLTKDFSDSTLHRFKKPGSKNYQNIYPPSATLHLSNIPPSVDEPQIREAFEQASCPVKDFKFFPRDRKMALIQLHSEEEAIEALIKMHDYQLSESSHLRVSFSKSQI